MKKLILTVFAVMFSFGAAGAGYANTLSGKIKDIDTAGNTITLVSDAGETTPSSDFKLVWDENLPQLSTLETAHVGEFLSVDAEQNPVTRNWKVATVKGPLAEAENAISSSERLISGTIHSIDPSGNRITLVTSEADTSGKTTEYRLVWDDTNKDVRNRLDKARNGDKISVKADQNKVTRNWHVNSVVGPIEDLVKKDVKTITGEVKSVNQAKNSMVLRTTDLSGKIVDRTIVWDKNFKDQSALQSARIGDHLTVRADQNMLTRNWRVKALGA